MIIYETMSYTKEAINCIKEKFYNLEWYEVYDFIEFFLNEFSIADKEEFVDELNKIFEEENVPYRIIEGLVTPLTSEQEREEIRKALNVSDKYQPIKNHLKKALEYYSKRPNPDPQNSIKESISALEALTGIITGNPKRKFKELIEKLSIHPAFREGLKKIYGWTSDEGGIRHSETGEELFSDQEEAHLMLVLSSAFVNYIISKYEN